MRGRTRWITLLAILVLGLLPTGGGLTYPDDEFPGFDEADVFVLARQKCPAGSDPSLWTRCNRTALSYVSGCASQVFHTATEICDKPLVTPNPHPSTPGTLRTACSCVEMHRQGLSVW